MEKIPESGLTEKDEDFCTSAGVIGILLSMVCLGQHIFIFPEFNWTTVPILAVFIYCTAAFILLLKRSASSYLLVLIAAAVTFLYIVFLIWLFFFAHIIIVSYILFFLLGFATIVAALMYVNGLPQRLKLHHRLLRQEDNYWTEKLNSR